MKKIRFTTETGSIYVLTKRTMTWERIAGTNKSGKIRTVSGKLLAWPDVVLGQSVALFCPPFVAEADVRVILTSRVKQIAR